MEIVRDSVFYSIPKSPKEGVRVKGKCVLVWYFCLVWSTGLHRVRLTVAPSYLHTDLPDLTPCPIM